MSGYVLGSGSCCACKARIPVFNQARVPSIRIDGRKEPLCEACARRWVELHPEAGFTIPDDAYTYCREEDL
jgi:hypothetical protein